MKFYSLFLTFILAALAAVFSGCASLELSKHAVRLELEYQRQSAPKLCGLAAMGMVTSYYQQAVSEADLGGLREEAESTGGISAASLKFALEEAGYYVAVFPGTLDRQASGLYRHLDLKRPLIVMTGVGTRHYSVAVGYDETKSLMVLLDPAAGAKVVPIKKFMQDWKEANYFTLLAMPEAKR